MNPASRQLVRRTNESLLSLFSRRTLVFLFFLMLSFFFWLLQKWDEEMEGDIAIPVVMTQVPDNVRVLTPLPKELRVKVKDTGTAFVRYWWRRTDTLRISFRDYETQSRSGRISVSTADLRRKLAESLAPSTKVQTFSPDTMVAYYNHGEHKRVPVRLVGVVKEAQGYMLQSNIVSPDTVSVYAFNSLLDTLTAVYTQSADTSDLRRTLTRTLRLQPLPGTVIEPQQVTQTATVDVLIDGKLEVPIISTNFPADRVLRTFPSNITVQYTVGRNLKNTIQPSDFVFVVTYEDILKLQETGATRLPLTLRRKPDGVRNVRFSPREVDYLIETNVEEQEEQ